MTVGKRAISGAVAVLAAGLISGCGGGGKVDVSGDDATDAAREMIRKDGASPAVVDGVTCVEIGGNQFTCEVKIPLNDGKTVDVRMSLTCDDTGTCLRNE